MQSRMLLIFVLCVIVVRINGDVPYPFEGKCNGTDYEHDGLCCSSCPSGAYAYQLCNSTHDTDCDLCDSGTYTQTPNHLPACLSCRGPCSSNQVELRSCGSTQDRICGCNHKSYCLLKTTTWPPSCRLCAPKTLCGVGFGVSGHKKNGDPICEKCGSGTHSNTVSSVDKCEPITGNNTFNEISLEITMYPVNVTSGQTIKRNGSITIASRELTVAVYYKDCGPIFNRETFTFDGQTETVELYTTKDAFQDTSKICTINVSIKCNNDEALGLLPHGLKKGTATYNMPHSEIVDILGMCLSSVDILFVYSDSNNPTKYDMVSFHITNAEI